MDIIGKGISRGAEWRKFQLHSTFHRGVKGPRKVTQILKAKTKPTLYMYRTDTTIHTSYSLHDCTNVHRLQTLCFLLAAPSSSRKAEAPTLPPSPPPPEGLFLARTLSSWGVKGLTLVPRDGRRRSSGPERVIRPECLILEGGGGGKTSKPYIVNGADLCIVQVQV